MDVILRDMTKGRRPDPGDMFRHKNEPTIYLCLTSDASPAFERSDHTSIFAARLDSGMLASFGGHVAVDLVILGWVGDVPELIPDTDA